MTLSLLIRGTAGILTVVTTREVIHLIRGTPEVMVAFIIVLMV